MPRRPLIVNVIDPNWMMMKWFLCRGMRSKDSPHQEKMELVYYVKTNCGTRTASSFRILDCALSCKFFVLVYMKYMLHDDLKVVALPLYQMFWTCTLYLASHHYGGDWQWTWMLYSWDGIFTYYAKRFCFVLCRPQTTIGTSMVLCHRFFVRRSHACHNRYVSLKSVRHPFGSRLLLQGNNLFLWPMLLQLIATAALFLAAKSEETARPLNNVLRASCEIYHKQDMSYLSYVISPVCIYICRFLHSFIFVFLQIFFRPPLVPILMVLTSLENERILIFCNS